MVILNWKTNFTQKKRKKKPRRKHVVKYIKK